MGLEALLQVARRLLRGVVQLVEVVASTSACSRHQRAPSLRSTSDTVAVLDRHIDGRIRAITFGEADPSSP